MMKKHNLYYIQKYVTAQNYFFRKGFICGWSKELCLPVYVIHCNSIDTNYANDSRHLPVLFFCHIEIQTYFFLKCKEVNSILNIKWIIYYYVVVR